jgi:hypothetical protein
MHGRSRHPEVILLPCEPLGYRFLTIAYRASMANVDFDRESILTAQKRKDLNFS